MVEMQCTCPYCGAVTDLPQPRGQDGAPLEVESLPYTRDVGRFDPPDREHWLDAGGWSRIGKDFFTLIGFDKIGILRAYRGLHVWYRVQACPQCEEFFDVYANFSEKRLADYWPHVLGKPAPDSDEIQPYLGQSWILWLLDRMAKWCRSRSLGVVCLALLLMALGLFPWLLTGQPAAEGGFPPGLVLSLLANGIATLGAAAILLLTDHYVRFESSEAFSALLNVRRRRDFIHWRNYTRARIVGVQAAGAKYPAPTQVDLIAGGLAALSMVLTWLAVRSGWLAAAAFAAGLAGLAGLWFGLQRMASGKPKRKSLLRAVLLVLLAILVLSAGVWLALQTPSNRWEAIHSAADLCFWLIIAVILGNGAWLAMNTVLYVLRGLRKVPLRLSPYNGFAQIAPLRKMESFSAWVMTALFFTLLGVVAVFIVLTQQVDAAAGSKTAVSAWAAFSTSLDAQRWLMDWMRWVIAIFFIAVGLGSRVRIVWLVVLYFGATLWLNSTSFADLLIDLPGIHISGDLLLMGVFLTLLLIYQVYQNESIVGDMVAAQRSRALREIDQQIQQVRSELDALNGLPSGGERMHSRLDTYQTLESLFSIREKIEKVSDRRTHKVVEIAGVFLWSIFLPSIISKLVDIVFQTI